MPRPIINEGWAAPGSHADSTKNRYDLKRGWLKPGEGVTDRGLQYVGTGEGGFDPSQVDAGWHSVISPKGVAAPIGSINYTPATGQVHAGGMQAPINEDNISLMPMDTFSFDQDMVGSGQGGPMLPPELQGDMQGWVGTGQEGDNGPWATGIMTGGGQEFYADAQGVLYIKDAVGLSPMPTSARYNWGTGQVQDGATPVMVGGRTEPSLAPAGAQPPAGGGGVGLPTGLEGNAGAENPPYTASTGQRMIWDAAQGRYVPAPGDPGPRPTAADTTPNTITHSGAVWGLRPGGNPANPADYTVRIGTSGASAAEGPETWNTAPFEAPNGRTVLRSSKGRIVDMETGQIVYVPPGYTSGPSQGAAPTQIPGVTLAPNQQAPNIGPSVPGMTDDARAGLKFSPYDPILRKHAGDLGGNDEFVAIVAAAILAESGGNPTIAGDNGDSVGIFQINKIHGLPDSVRTDPDASTAFMMPKFIAAYNKYKAQGYSGAQLATLVAGEAEGSKPEHHHRYGTAFQTVTSQGPGAFTGDWTGTTAGLTGAGPYGGGPGGGAGGFFSPKPPEKKTAVVTTADGRRILIDMETGQQISEVGGPEREKPLAVGNRAIKYNEQTGTYDVVYEGPTEKKITQSGPHLFSSDPETGETSAIYSEPGKPIIGAAGVFLPPDVSLRRHAWQDTQGRDHPEQVFEATQKTGWDLGPHIGRPGAAAAGSQGAVQPTRRPDIVGMPGIEQPSQDPQVPSWPATNWGETPPQGTQPQPGDQGGFGLEEDDPYWQDAPGLGWGQAVGSGQSIPPIDPEHIVGGGNKFGEQVSMEGIHKGTDLQAYEGTPVQSPIFGTVESVETDPEGLGLQVQIRGDDGALYVLAHLLSADVQPGDSVEQGQVVARVGESGAGATGPHLDYRIQDAEGGWRNPEPELGALGQLPEAPNTVPEGAGKGQRGWGKGQSDDDLMREYDYEQEVLRRAATAPDPQAGLGYPPAGGGLIPADPTGATDLGGWNTVIPAGVLPPETVSDIGRYTRPWDEGDTDTWDTRNSGIRNSSAGPQMSPDTEFPQGQPWAAPTYDHPPQQMPSMSAEHPAPQERQPWQLDFPQIPPELLAAGAGAAAGGAALAGRAGQALGGAAGGLGNAAAGMAGMLPRFLFDPEQMYGPQGEVGEGQDVGTGQVGPNQYQDTGPSIYQRQQLELDQQRIDNERERNEQMAEAEDQRHRAAMASARNEADRIREQVRHDKAMEKLRGRELDLQKQGMQLEAYSDAMQRNAQYRIQGTFGQQQQAKLLQSALTNPWLQNLSGMAPGYGLPGWNATTGGGVLQSLLNGWNPQQTPDFSFQEQVPSGPKWLRKDLQSQQGSQRLSGARQWQAEDAGRSPQGGGGGIGNPIDAVMGANPSTTAAWSQAGYGGYAPLGSAPPTPGYQDWRKMSPFERASWRTLQESAQPFPAAVQQAREGWAKEGVFDAPNASMFSATQMDPMEMRNQNTTAEMFGESPEDYWKEQRKTWATSAAPSVTQKFGG